MKRIRDTVISLVILAMLLPVATKAQDDYQLCNLAFAQGSLPRIVCNDFFERLDEMTAVDAEVEAIAARFSERREVFDLVPWPVTPENETEAAMVSAWLEGAKAEHAADMARLNELISRRQLLLAQVTLISDNLEQVRRRILGEEQPDDFLAGLARDAQEAALNGAIALINRKVDRDAERANLDGWADLDNEMALLAVDFAQDNVTIVGVTEPTDAVETETAEDTNTDAGAVASGALWLGLVDYEAYECGTSVGPAYSSERQLFIEITPEAMIRTNREGTSSTTIPAIAPGVYEETRVVPYEHGDQTWDYVLTTVYEVVSDNEIVVTTVTDNTDIARVSITDSQGQPINVGCTHTYDYVLRRTEAE